MSKSTARASTDIAFVKYWGKKDEVLNLPENGSISMALDSLHTTTTVEFSSKYTRDSLFINDAENAEELARAQQHLDRIRTLVGGKTEKAKIVSENNFPKSTGLSSSGSGFAALTIAACTALSLDLNQKELSILARQGSGSACRGVCGGFVEWKDGATSEESYSASIFPASYWEIHDVIAIVSEDIKHMSSSKGHESASSSIFFKTRQANIQKKIAQVKEALVKKDFEKLGELIEAESYEFHSILLTSNPSLLMWNPGTIEILQLVKSFRMRGIPAYATINTGHNVHILTLPEFSKLVQQEVAALPLVQSILLAKPGVGPKVLENHLF